MSDDELLRRIGIVRSADIGDERERVEITNSESDEEISVGDRLASDDHLGMRLHTLNNSIVDLGDTDHAEAGNRNVNEESEETTERLG